MYAQSIIKNLFSIINIFLITYLLIDRKNNQEYRKKNWYSYVLCIGSIFLVRVMENGVSIHIVYNYIMIVIIVMFIGHFLFQRNMKYCILIGSVFLSISLLGQLLSSIFLYPYSGNRVLAELPGIYQVVMMVIAESVIIAGCLTLKKIIERIPPHLSSINVMTIFIPLLLNIIVMAVCTDNLYNDKKVIIGNIWSVITISIVPIVMFLGTVCNIVILENYLNVKKIENEKKLQISEMSLQYDYYMKQSKDMENIRRLSHDIKNHLEVLKENIEPEQKIEYINGIERKLNKYQSYYKSGNTFIDNLLHTKRLEAIEKGIEFKVFADFTEFRQIRNEDLCVIISNTIDNALRECRLMKEENPMVECLVQLKAKKVKGFLSILCENSLRDSQVRYLRENATLETSKEDKKNHGFGVKNIKSVVKDYGGEVSFSVLDDMFSVSVIIPIEI